MGTSVEDAKRDKVSDRLDALLLEQQETNRLLRRLLVPVELICRQIHLVAVAIWDVRLMLWDCRTLLSSVLSHVTTLTALMQTLVAAAAQRALLVTHDAHVSTGMRLATAASLAACLAVQLPYAWGACSGAMASGRQLPGIWGSSRQPLRQQSPGLWGFPSHRPQGTPAGGVAWAWGGGTGSVKQQPGGALGGWLAEQAVGLTGAAGALVVAAAHGMVFELAAAAGYGGPVSAVTMAVCRAVMAGRLIVASLLLLATLLVASYVRSRIATSQPPGTTAPTKSSALSTILSSLTLGCMLPGAAQQQGASPSTCQVAAVQPSCATSSAHPHLVTVAQRETHWGQQQQQQPAPALPVLDMLLLSARSLLAHAPSTLAALAVARGHPTAWLLLQLAWHVGLPHATVALCTAPGGGASGPEPWAYGCSAGALVSPLPSAFAGNSYQLHTRADGYAGAHMSAAVQGPTGTAGQQDPRSRWRLLAAAAWVYLLPLVVGFLPAVGAERLASWASRAAATVVVVGIAAVVVGGGAGSMLGGKEEGRGATGPGVMGLGPGGGGGIAGQVALEDEGRSGSGAYGSGRAPGVVGARAGAGGLGGVAGGVWAQGDGAVVVARVQCVGHTAPTGKLDKHALW